MLDVRLRGKWGNIRIIPTTSHLFHQRLRLRQVICGYGNRPVDRVGGIDREEALVKLSRVRDDSLLGGRVPEPPGLVIGWVSNEYTLLCVRLQLCTLVLLDVDIGSAAKHMEMGNVRLGAMPVLKWSA